MRRLVALFLAHTPVQYWPVRIRHGYLAGARWTLWPHSAYWRGHYEPEVQAALARVAPPRNGVAWDLGAHFGFYTLWLARAVGPAGQICAFEPDPVSCARLRRHVAMNRCDHVRVYPLAVSDRDETQQLVLSQGAGATTSHLPYQGEDARHANTIAVRSAALDELARRDELRAPHFIKIDVEGHASAALRGARRTLEQHRPVILVSLHSPDEADGVRTEVSALHYRLHNLVGAPISWADALFQTVLLTP